MKKIKVSLLLLILIVSLFNIAAASTYKRGDRNIFIGRAQKALIKVRCYNGKITNKIDAKTEKAIALFQKINNIDQSGVLDEQTQDVLFSSKAITYNQWLYLNHLSILSSKIKDETDIKYYQTQLNKKGYPVEITGVYDSATIISTKYIQDYYRMKITGKADKAVREKANDNSLIAFSFLCEESRKEAIKGGTKHYLSVFLAETRLSELGYLSKVYVNHQYDTQTKKAFCLFQQFHNLDYTKRGDNQTLSFLYSEDAKPLSYFDDENTLRPGTKSTKVEELQSNLYLLGLYKGQINGTYGTKTTAAIKAFQKKHSIYPSGVAYKNTLEAIDSAVYDKKNNKYIEEVIKIGISKLGCKYKSKGVGPQVFDCCGFTRYCYIKGAGITLTSTVKAQATYSKGVIIHKLEDCPRGCILIFKNENKKYAHTALYLGNYQLIHASYSAKKVVVVNFGTGTNSEKYYKSNFVCGVVIL